MDPVSFIKVLMLTTFLGGGEIIAQEFVETTLVKCELAKEEAVRFNNKFLWAKENLFFSDNRRLEVSCFRHPETIET